MPLEESFFTKLQQCVSLYRDVQGLKEKKKKPLSAECKVICGNKKEKRHHCDANRECAKLRNPRVAEEEGLKGLLKRRARLKTFSPGPWYGYPRCRGRDARVCLLVGGRGIDVKKKGGGRG